MEACKQEVHHKPHFPHPSVMKMRLDLIQEEVAELQAAVEGMDMFVLELLSVDIWVFYTQVLIKPIDLA